MSTIDPLRRLVQDWLATAPRALETTAALKDCLALIEIAPSAVEALLPGSPAAVALSRISRDLLHFLKFEVSKLLKTRLGNVSPLVSPYAGGLVCAQAQQAARTSTKGFTLPHLRVAVLNPGRTGFTQLGNDALLFWRLWAVSFALMEMDIHICALPGARLPPGALLPEGFPFVYLGGRSSGWDTVGVFVLVEPEPCITLLEAFSSDRILWLAVSGSSGQNRTPQCIIGTFYAAPGGDRVTWAAAMAMNV